MIRDINLGMNIRAGSLISGFLFEFKVFIHRPNQIICDAYVESNIAETIKF